MNEPIRMTRGGADCLHLQDDLMSVIAASGRMGGVMETVDYLDYGTPIIRDASGKAVDRAPSGNTRLFTGQSMDWESTSQRFRSRILDSSAGHFAPRDSIGLREDEEKNEGGWLLL